MKVQKRALQLTIGTLTLVLGTLSLNCNNNSSSVDFSREYTGVTFDALVSPGDVYSAWRYGEAGLSVLLKKVHSKFDRILVWIDTFYGSPAITDLVPAVAAKVNRENQRHALSSSQMKIVILFQFTSDYVHTEEEVHAGIQKIQDIADQANSIFPGTIESILWYESNKMNGSLLNPFKLFCAHFHKCPQPRDITLRQFPYKIGIILDITSSGLVHLEAEESRSDRTLVAIMSKKLDIIYFEMNTEISSSFQHATEAVTHLKGKLNRIKTEFEEKSPKTEIGFYTWWPDTGDDGFASYSSLVQFWKEMDLWARSAKRQVILYQALDNIYQTSIKLRTTGWWRLIPSAEYRNASDFVFEEKRCLRDDLPVDRMVKELNRTWLAQDVSFNRNFVGVTGLPVIVKGQTQYSDTGLNELVEYAAAQFSKLALFRSVETGLLSSSLETASSQIPNIVAKLNSRKAAMGKGTEVILWFQSRSFSLVSKLASDANKIFPGTVKALVFEGQDANYGNVGNWSKRVREAGYKFGISMTMAECTNYVIFKEKVASALSSIDVVYLDGYGFIDAEHVKLGFERISKEVTVSAEICKKNIQEHVRDLSGRNVEVALVTGWPYFKGSSLSNLVALVKYWEFLNEWATKTKITTIFCDAFVQPDWAVDTSGTSGWWEVEQNQLSPKLTFVSRKKILLKKVLDEEARAIPSTNWRHSNIVAAATIAASAAIIFTVASIVGVYIWKRKSERLSKSEVDEFFKGVTSEQNNYSEDPLDKPYNEEKYEMGKSRFSVEESSPLGSGAFGSVCRGHVSGENGEGMEVAVKTTKDKCPRSALMGLLSEVKILSHLGKHENILELVGAHTTELRKGKVFVFLELCELGSLEGHLRECKRRSESIVEDHSEIDNSIAADMVRWSAEIANGMKFISSKHVVHLDLATRNVLLTADKTAKISDFGLSRRLENYQTYVKKQQEPLPWRWMSPESLHRLEFTEKSDVWAFGVTLWEIFSLGDIPYPGLSWDVNFATQLDRGLRLEVPSHSQSDMYSVMLRCWATNPEGRPTFAELSATLDEKKVMGSIEYLQVDFEHSPGDREQDEAVTYINADFDDGYMEMEMGNP